MTRMILSVAFAGALLVAPASAVHADPAEPIQVRSAQSANDRMPFPALMNSLFGRQRPTAAPEPRFRRPGDAGTPTPRVIRQPAPRYATPVPEARTAARTPAPQAAPRARQMDPRYERQVVAYAGSERPGTIVVDTSERFLYLVQEDGTALRYGVGVGREGFSWRGTERITRMAEWPSWRPPEAMKRRQPGLPDYMPGGPNNPLGARALYLGSTLYRIHGSNEPWTIGQAMSSGCIRMRNDDVIHLYDRVSVGATVVVR